MIGLSMCVWLWASGMPRMWAGIGARLALVAACLCWSAPAWAQPSSIRASLTAARALYPTPMSPAQVSEMLSRGLAGQAGWALMRKDGGSSCPTPYAGIRVSCDWIIDVPSGWGYDVIADVEGAGRLTWSDGVPNGAGIQTVAPWPVGVPQPPQEPEIPPVGGAVTPDVIRAIVSSEVDKIYAQNERIFAALTQLDDLNTNAILGRLDKIQEDINNPGWFKQVVSNRYVQIIAAGLAAYFSREMVAGQKQ